MLKKTIFTFKMKREKYKITRKGIKVEFDKHALHNTTSH